jgi:transposase/5-methylcytosine-specific restriction endonuclease McrA
MDAESLRLLLGQGLSVEKIARRFGKDPSTISSWMGQYGLEAVNREKHAAKGGIDQERLEKLVGAGMTIAEIATDVGLSKGTVRHWLRVHGLRTLNTRGRRSSEVARRGKDDGFLSVLMSCEHHGEAEFALEGRGYYRCKQCRTTAVVRRRRRVKAILVTEAGGGCVLCGYDRYVGALEFHHIDPADKRREISGYGVTLSLDAVRAEALKCVLLCSNCHAEVEAGVTTVPLQFRRRLPNKALNP